MLVACLAETQKVEMNVKKKRRRKMAEWYNNSLKQHVTLPPFFISLMYLFLLLLPRQLMTRQKKIQK